MQTNKQTHKQANTHKHTQTNKHTNKHTNTNKQTNKQTFPFLYLSTTSVQKLKKKANQTLLPFLSRPLKHNGEEGKRVREGRTLIVMVAWERGGVVGFVLNNHLLLFTELMKDLKMKEKEKEGKGTLHDSYTVQTLTTLLTI